MGVPENNAFLGLENSTHRIIPIERANTRRASWRYHTLSRTRQSKFDHFGDSLQQERTRTLIKTGSLELIRLVMPAGKELSTHDVPGELTVQCLEGRVLFRAGSEEHELTAGMLVLLEGSTPHSLHALEDSSLLATVLLVHKRPAQPPSGTSP